MVGILTNNQQIMGDIAAKNNGTLGKLILWTESLLHKKITPPRNLGLVMDLSWGQLKI